MIRRPDPSLLQLHDCLLFDLDGTLMNGSDPIAHAADGVRRAREAGVTLVFATNNASRTPQQAADHLATVGVTAHADEMITSPQVASSLLARTLEPGQKVLVIGGDSLAAEVRAAGFDPVREDSADVAAVVQGWAPDVGWAQLAEGAFAIGHGALYVATNTDATLPTERGFAPGNGSLVAALQHATGVDPLVAGKPEPGMFEVAVERVGARRPLVIGDRLDTDIAGANRAGMPSLLVLTGVSTIEDALRATPLERPTAVLPDLSALHHGFPLPVVSGTGARCGRSGAEMQGEDIRLHGSLDDMLTVRAVLALLADQRPDEAFTGRVLDADGSEVIPAP